MTDIEKLINNLDRLRTQIHSDQDIIEESLKIARKIQNPQQTNEADNKKDLNLYKCKHCGISYPNPAEADICCH
ncbi:MAG: hypothetical protein PVG65_07300 [Candidatus Thorarchaeota archaeon]